MYERNAIVIDRYFASIFGYDNRSNLKNNSTNYFELVKILENYQEASEAENKIMQEFESIATQIKETQKLQEVLNKRSIKYNEVRRTLFESLDEEPEVLKKKFEKLDEEINRNNQDIKSNSEKFVKEIADFNEKSETRSISGRERRVVENEYQKILTATVDNFNSISREKLREAKAFVKSDNKNEAKRQIRDKILKNGSKEKVPFDQNVIETAIDTSTYIEEKKAEILLSLFDKTNRLLDEIKNDSVKIEKHKKIVTDSKSKLEFLSAISDYIVLFLDNERMNTMGGELEHHRIMQEACDNLQSDLVEIQNMYSLLIKEITGKSTKKAYKELYNIQYMLDLKEEEKQFENSIKKLNMLGTVVYPDYWRVEGMQKIYDTFKRILTDIYAKDLSEYEPLDITFSVNEEDLKDEEKVETKETKDNENTEQQEETPNDNTKESKDGVQSNENVEEEKKEENQNTEKSPTIEKAEEEFTWDDEDEDDELIFSTEKADTELEEGEQPSEDTQNAKPIPSDKTEENEEEIDKEIDEILGFFDDEDEDLEEEKEEVVISGADESLVNEEESESDDGIFDDDEDSESDDKIFDDDDDEDDDEIEQELEKAQQKKEKKRRGLFSRRNK